MDLLECSPLFLLLPIDRPLDDGGERVKEKTSLAVLEQSFQELDSRKIKDTLSSFLPDIPGL